MYFLNTAAFDIISFEKVETTNIEERSQKSEELSMDCL